MEENTKRPELNKKMDLGGFIEMLVKIEHIESTNTYGHHPMQLLTVSSKGNEINALVHLGMGEIVTRVKEYLDNKTDEIFLSLDLPAIKDVPHDFVLALHIKDNKINDSVVLEYSSTSGEVITRSDGSQYDAVSEISNYFV